MPLKEREYSSFHPSLGCDGCNGGITENPEEYFGDYTYLAVRLRPFLLQEYSQKFVDNVCIIKMDTEECRDLDI